MSDLVELSALELAERIARREVSSAEAVAAHIERIREVDGKLNAVVVERFAAALAEAQRADRMLDRSEPVGPLHGVPVTVKESLDLAGTPSTFGIPSRAGIPAIRDDPYVAALRATGAIVVGKTNVAQLLIYGESDNPVYGRTNNPWNPERTCGGSSGGEGAIIAARGSPLGLGTDIGGSVRIPAAFCGVVGFKPTAGRTPDVSRHSIPPGQRAIVSQVGVLARRVEDVALGVGIISGAADAGLPGATTPGLPGTADAGLSGAADTGRGLGGSPGLRTLGRGLAGLRLVGRASAAHPPDLRAIDVSALRVAAFTDDGTFAPAGAVRRAVEEATTILSDRGARVDEWRPPGVGDAIALYYGLLSADGGRWARELLGRDERDPRADALIRAAGRSRPVLAAWSALLRLVGQRRTARSLTYFGDKDTHSYWKKVEALLDYRRRFSESLVDADGRAFDVVVFPPYAVPAGPHGISGRIGTAGGYALLANVLGWPAGAVPVTRVRGDEKVEWHPSRDRVEQAAHEAEAGAAGLPVGAQVMARPGHDDVALAVMRVIEEEARERPDFPRLPA